MWFSRLYIPGMREGELLALKWDNVNLTKKSIYVKESVKRVAIFDSDGEKHMETITQSPKTRNSIRTIYIPDKLVNKLDEIEIKKGYVFSDTNTPITHKSLYNWWTRFLKNNNIPHRKFHALRHTYASLLLAKGADLKSVQDLMGHYDIRITQTYLHSIPNKQIEIVNKVFDN